MSEAPERIFVGRITANSLPTEPMKDAVWGYVRADIADHDRRQRDRLFEQLRRNRQGYANLLELDWITYEGHRQAITEVMIEIDAAIAECEENDA